MRSESEVRERLAELVNEPLALDGSAQDVILATQRSTLRWVLEGEPSADPETQGKG